MTWHNLRQQTEKPAGNPNYCLADFVAPKDSGREGLHRRASPSPPASASTRAWPSSRRQHDDYSAIMLKALADRLAEAFAELLHERVRREFWGYASG